MNIELCDWCGDHKAEGEGATIKIYEQKENHGDYLDRLWGSTYKICAGCFMDIKRKVDGIIS